MITPFDRLIYASAKFQEVYGVYKHFLEMLQTVRIDTFYWPEWRDVLADNRDRTLLPVAPAALWDLGPNFCVCTPRGIMPQLHRPTVADGTEGAYGDIPLDAEQWELDALLVFRRSETSFDVIPMMTNCRTVDGDNTPFPEIQLRYQRTETGWAWTQSPTGFVNAFAYGPLLDDLPLACQRRITQSVNWLGNYVLMYLGTYDTWLAQAGTWDVHEPKPPRYKTKNGKVKKIYTIAQAGFKRYMPDPVGQAG